MYEEKKSLDFLIQQPKSKIWFKLIILVYSKGKIWKTNEENM